MGIPHEPTDDPKGMVSVSLPLLRSMIENAILKLEISLAEKFANHNDIARLEDGMRGLVKETQQRFERVETTQESLERDKAGRDAVASFKRYLTGGAVLGTIFMFMQLMISLYLVTHRGGR